MYKFFLFLTSLTISIIFFRYNLTPRAKIVSLGVVGSDPVIMLEGPIPATVKALERANLTIDQMDLYEVNEAFCSVPLAWAKALGADKAKLNVNGGAMALGHPLGATGKRFINHHISTGMFGLKTHVVFKYF